MFCLSSSFSSSRWIDSLLSLISHQGYEPDLELPAWLIADNLLFLTRILVVFRNHSPCHNCAFSSSVPGFLIKSNDPYLPTLVLEKKNKWNVFKMPWKATGLQEENENQGPHTAGGASQALQHFQLWLIHRSCYTLCFAAIAQPMSIEFIHLKWNDTTPQ